MKPKGVVGMWGQLVKSVGGLETLETAAGDWGERSIVQNCALTCKIWPTSGSVRIALHMGNGKSN